MKESKVSHIDAKHSTTSDTNTQLNSPTPDAPITTNDVKLNPSTQPATGAPITTNDVKLNPNTNAFKEYDGPRIGTFKEAWGEFSTKFPAKDDFARCAQVRYFPCP